jgi:hypothetical protein
MKGIIENKRMKGIAKDDEKRKDRKKQKGIAKDNEKQNHKDDKE